jgi:hypothetical protein
MTGTSGAAATVITRPERVFEPLASDTMISKGDDVPEVVGVPVIAPVEELKERPAGSEPTKVKLLVPLPPVTTGVKL